MNKTRIDPITLEVMRNSFYSISDEMVAALVRASYSTNIKDPGLELQMEMGHVPRGTGHLFVTGKNPVLTGKHAQMTGFSRHLTGKFHVQSLWAVPLGTKVSKLRP